MADANRSNTLMQQKPKQRSRTPVIFYEDAQGQQSPPFDIDEQESDDGSPRDFIKVFEVGVAAKPAQESLVPSHKRDKRVLKKVRSKKKMLSVPTI